MPAAEGAAAACAKPKLAATDGAQRCPEVHDELRSSGAGIGRRGRGDVAAAGLKRAQREGVRLRKLAYRQVASRRAARLARVQLLRAHVTSRQERAAAT